MPKMSELVPDYDVQIRVWETYRDMVKERFELSDREAVRWANEMMKFDFDLKNDYDNKD